MKQDEIRYNFIVKDGVVAEQKTETLHGGPRRGGLIKAYESLVKRYMKLDQDWAALKRENEYLKEQPNVGVGYVEQRLRDENEKLKRSVRCLEHNIEVAHKYHKQEIEENSKLWKENKELKEKIAALSEPVLDENGLARCGCGGKAGFHYSVMLRDNDCYVACGICGEHSKVALCEEKARDAWNRAMGVKGADE